MMRTDWLKADNDVVVIFFLAIKEIRNTLDLLSTAIQQSF